MLKSLIEHGHKVQILNLSQARVGLHCMATSAGFEKRFNEAYSWDGLKRGSSPFLVIQHTIAGRGQLDFAGTRHRLEPGDTMLLSFPHANRYWLEKGDSWEYFWIVLNGREALRLARAVIDSAGPVLVLAPSAIDRLAAACLALIASEAPQPGEASAAAYAAMMAIHDGVLKAPANEVEALPPVILRVRQYVDSHLAERLDISRLAQIAQMSRAHFVRQFGSAVGTAPSDYVFDRRMERASRLLLATDSSVLGVAQACGFADANYFAKAFRRAYGMTPTAYRSAGMTLLPEKTEPRYAD